SAYVQRRASWIQRQMYQLGGPAYIEGRAPPRAPR
ncbi:MAG TPA: monofunctional biosynthetic peptidoglycan transglycosylase, partial [Rhodanobacter sp.]|nr:monofunctional biosynthetic peptidoglycan transglycosylase [Rhodanobacter sp.]